MQGAPAPSMHKARWRRKWASLHAVAARESAAVALEFAVILPVMLLLLIGTFDLSRYIIATLKVNNAAYAIADTITQFPIDNSPPNPVLTRTVVGDVLDTGNPGLIEELMRPVDVSAANPARVRIASLSAPNDPNAANVEVDWIVDDGQAALGTSLITVDPGDPATPLDFTIAGAIGDAINDRPLADGENYIMVEVFYQFNFLFALQLGPNALPFGNRTISARAAFAPRFNNLEVID